MRIAIRYRFSFKNNLQRTQCTISELWVTHGRSRAVRVSRPWPALVKDWVMWDSGMDTANYAKGMRTGSQWGGAVELAVCAKVKRSWLGDQRH